jgi:hypothetical protein
MITVPNMEFMVGGFSGDRGCGFLPVLHNHPESGKIADFE